MKTAITLRLSPEVIDAIKNQTACKSQAAFVETAIRAMAKIEGVKTMKTTTEIMKELRQWAKERGGVVREYHHRLNGYKIYAIYARESGECISRPRTPASWRDEYYNGGWALYS